MISSLQSIGPAAAGVAIPLGSAGEVLLVATVFVGMGLSDIASGIFGDDEDEDGSESDGDGDFAGEGTMDDDPLDGDLGDDDEFGDLDGWDEDDDLGGEDGGSAAELEPRLDELENEVANISSSMGTVRSENEAINETVDEIEDNIRKLLDIYEMVTRGVNPFVDDAQGGGGGGMDGSFGLFDDASAPDDGTDDLDPDVANADPDEFFDDDFDDEPAEDFDDDLEDSVDEDEAPEQVEEPEPADADDAEEAGGKTFDDLKSEYQSGDAEWDEDGESGADTAQHDTTVEVESDDSADPTPTQATDGDDLDSTEGDEEEPTPSADDGKPYLASLPGGYASELLVIEWLTYLRDCSGTAEALRAIRYYETIGWIGAPAAETLQRYLTGLGHDEATETGGGTQLTIDHHTNSLRYIGRLGGADVDVERLEWGSSAPTPNRIERRGQRGIQR